jgi:hypothetical protein
MNDHQIDKIIDQALHEESALPEGLSSRLEQYIDALPPQAQTAPRRRPTRPAWRWLGGMAAALLVGITVFVATEQPRPKPVTDTCANPQEAAIAAQKALTLVSFQLNKGMHQIALAGQELEKATQTIQKHTTLYYEK